MMNRTIGVVIAGLLVVGCSKKKEADGGAAPEVKAKPVAGSAAAAAAKGLQVSNKMDINDKALPQYDGAYDKAIAYRPADSDRMYIYVVRGCPTLSCSFDRYDRKASCPNGWAVVADFTTFALDAKPGPHPANVVVANWAAEDDDFIGDPVEVNIQELSATTVAGSIDYKSDRGTVKGSFTATICKDQ